MCDFVDAQSCTEMQRKDKSNPEADVCIPVVSRDRIIPVNMIIFVEYIRFNH